MRCRTGGSPLFRIFDHGKNVGAMYAGQCAGKYLVDTLTPSARARTLETYELTELSRIPVYTVSGILDAMLRPVISERLLLPFSMAGARVSRIVAFLETISPDGLFDRRALMSRPQTDAGYAIKAVLRTNAQ